MLDFGQHRRWDSKKGELGELCQYEFMLPESDDIRRQPILREANLETGMIYLVRLLGVTDYDPNQIVSKKYDFIQFGGYWADDPTGGFFILLPAVVAEQVFKQDSSMRSWGNARNMPK